MLLMLTSGPRVSEITALTWGDLCRQARRPRALARQGTQGTHLPAQTPAITGLRQWQRENPGPVRFVFTARGTTGR